MKTLIATSGLAWNLKSTILDEFMHLHGDDESMVRLEQTNKSYIKTHPNATPKELMTEFLSVNKNSINNNDVIITDRSPLDYYIYDIMMNPCTTHEHALYQYPSNCKDKLLSITNTLMTEFYNQFDKVVLITLQTTDREFIDRTFSAQPYSSTSYLFDNYDKYKYYSELFYSVSDNIVPIMKYDSNHPDFRVSRFALFDESSINSYKSSVLGYIQSQLYEL